MKNIKVLSWNINSVRIRYDLLKYIFDKYSPEIIALQETKVSNSEFPLEIFIEHGYIHNYLNGNGHYSGVSLHSKIPCEELPHINFAGLHSRDVSIKVGGIEIHNLYIPAGGDVPSFDSLKFAQKIAYFNELIVWSSEKKLSESNTIILGDLNIAPLPEDVWSHKQLLKEVSHTPLETGLMNSWIHDNALVDVPRKFFGDGKLYSWWSYRNRDYKKSNRGRRLDHVIATPLAARYITHMEYLHYFRDFPKTSDHVPAIFSLNLDQINVT